MDMIFIMIPLHQSNVVFTTNLNEHLFSKIRCFISEHFSTILSQPVQDDNIARILNDYYYLISLIYPFIYLRLMISNHLAKANRNSSPTYSLGYCPAHSLGMGDFFRKLRVSKGRHFFNG